jgi:methionine-rich copper-binding protein CopC
MTRSASTPSSLARALLLALAVSASGAGPAHAHSGLERAEPPAESALPRAPKDVKLHFSEQLEPAYSSVRVEDANGVQVDGRDGHVDRANPRLLRASLKSLEAGVYTVIWRVLSVDSHVTEGQFTFRVQ